jgi:hypothetical protein
MIGNGIANNYTQFGQRKEEQVKHAAALVNETREKASPIRNSGHPDDILIVDDDRDILLTYKMILEDDG